MNDNYVNFLEDTLQATNLVLNKVIAKNSELRNTIEALKEHVEILESLPKEGKDDH